MATGSREADDIQGLLECSICLEPQATLRQLPCLHTFCLDCIQTIIDKRRNKRFPCPQCSHGVDIPEEGAAGFPLTSALGCTNDCMPCPHKGSTVGAETMCTQCAHHSGKNSLEIHRQNGETSSHNEVSLDEVAAGAPVSQDQKTCCPKHPNKSLNMYCEKCKILVCALCRKKGHNKHKVSTLEEAASKAIRVIESLIEPWLDAVDHAQILSNERKGVIEDLTPENVTKKLEELCRIYDDFKKKLDDSLEIKKSEIITSLIEQYQLVKKQVQRAFAGEVIVGIQQITILSQPEVSPESPSHCLTLQPAVKERAVGVNRVKSRRKRELGTGCSGLTVCDGGFVITDGINNNVKVIDDRDCTLKFMVQQKRHKLRGPVDVTCHENGEIFITDLGVHGVVRYDAHGRLMKVYRGVYQSEGYIACHNDRLVVSDTDGERVIITDLDCNVVQQLDARSLGLEEFIPHYVCMDNYGHVVVVQCYPGRVHVIDYTQPAIINTLTDKLSGAPCGVCVDIHDYILVADHFSNQVVLYNDERAHVITGPGDVSFPAGMCISGPGLVSLVERESGMVKTFQYLED